VGILTVDSKGRITAASNIGINFSTATVAQADKLTTPRNIAITGDLSWNVNFDGSVGVTSIGTLSNTGVSSGTYGSSTQVGILTVDSKGRITAASNVNIDFGNAVVAKANYADNAGIATNLKGGNAYQIAYQSSLNTTAFISTTGAQQGQLLQYNTSSPPSWVAPAGLNVDKANYATKAGLATDVELNGTNQILYQASNNDTQLLPAGTANQLLQSNGSGSAPSWINATGLSVSIADYAHNAGISTNLKGGAAGSIPYQTSANTTTFLAGTNVNGRILTWNNSTNAPIWTDPNNVVAGTATSLNVTLDGSSTPRYLVLSSTTSGVTTALVDAGITYTPSSDLLTVSNIKPASIQDTSGGTGSSDNILTANGSGGWTWKSINSVGGISGIIIKDEGNLVGSAITSLNFIGDSVTATSPSVGVANITISGGGNVSVGVSQVNYNCSPPITSVGSSIVIAADSNAYGRRYVQSTQPANACDGDLWFDTSTSGPGIIPIGGIIMWSGTIATIPTGWALCDGNSGTPNLRDRFIVGAGSAYSPGNTGGADSVTLTTNQIPAHNHTTTIDGFRVANAAAAGGVPSSVTGGNANAIFSMSNTGGSQAHENRPPYYALAFIMRVS
jgi:microcystin-dependent protein